MGMLVLKKKRKRPGRGDIFVYKYEGVDYGFGRVIRTDVSMDPLSDLLLIYIYDAFSSDKEKIPELRKDRLLVPPALLIDNGPWGKGIFLTVKAQPLHQRDVLRCHCFRDEVFDCYVDEDGCRLARRRKPCGIYAAQSYVTIQAKISNALGLGSD